MKKYIFSVFLFFVIIVSTANAASLTLTWDAPTTWTDGTPFALSDVEGYTVYYDK